jgi:outer membrane protein assembly factor BamA
VRKNTLVLGLCSIGVLFLSGFQSPVALSRPSQGASDTQVNPCLKSTCRDVPLREHLTAIDLRTEDLGTKYVRGIVGGFEHGAGIDGGVQFTSANAIPHFELRAAALTSTTLFRRFDLEAVINIGNRNHADVWFSYMQRQNDFFGIGPLTSNSIKNSFATDQRSYQGSIYRDITAHLQGGVYTQVMNSHSGSGNSKKDTPITEGFSGTPDESVERWIPGFLSTTQILSYGGFVEYDTRDKSVDLTRGVDLYGRVASRDGMNNHAAFADYGWLEAEYDARGYIPLGSSRTSLALRSRGQFENPKGGSQIPFYDLSYLGGREYVRGYQSYRFRGNNVLILSTELRRTVYKKTNGRGVDVFGFADSGQVWGDARSSTDPAIVANQTLRSSNWQSGVGGGLQYRHSRGLAARLEVGRSNEGSRIYASMSRGF